MLLNWVKASQGGAQSAAAVAPGEPSSPGSPPPPSAAKLNKLARNLWREGRSERRNVLGGTSAQAALALDFITEAGLSLRALRSLKLGKDLQRHKGRYWLGEPGDKDAVRLSSTFSRRLHRYIKQWRDNDGPGRLVKEGNNKLALKPLHEQLDAARSERFDGTLTLKQLTSYAQEGTYRPSQPRRRPSFSSGATASIAEMRVPDRSSTPLPPSPREWLAEDHQVYFLLDLVDELDLSEILIPAQAKDPRGEKGFDPRMLTLLLLYAYCVGTVSSRKIERACYEDLAFRVLTGNQQPDHSRISDFRRRNLDAQEDRRYGKTNRGSDLPDELLRRQDRLERIRQARKEMEAETAAAAARQRQEEADQARAQADAAKEDEGSAAEQAELNRSVEAAAAKASAAREKAEETAKAAGLEPPDLQALEDESMPRRGLARKANGTPTAKTQRNFTDPGSHLMKSDGHYIGPPEKVSPREK